MGKNKYLENLKIEAKERVLKVGEATVLRAYEDSKRLGIEFIIIRDNIWDKNMPDTIKTLKKSGEEYLIFASGWSSAIETLYAFLEAGMKVIDSYAASCTDSWGDTENIKGLLLKIK